MAKILDMPKLSPTMEEGVLAIWHKKEGDVVGVDDLLAEVETDKATMEFRSFDKGEILKILVGAGATVKLGQPVAIIGQPGENIDALLQSTGGLAPAAAAPAAKEAPRAEPVAVAVAVASHDEAPKTLAPPPARAPRAPADPLAFLTRTEQLGDDAPVALNGANGKPLASPFIRSRARELGLDLAQIAGTGKHGRVLPEDLSQSRALTLSTPATAPAQGQALALAVPRLAEPKLVPLSPMRRTIAKRLVQSKQTVPHFYLQIDVRADELVHLRESINAELAREKPKGDGAPKKISVNDLLIKAVAAALVRVPECNAQFSEEGLLYHQRVDVSVAVAVPDGLVTPVVRDADKKSVVAIAEEVRDLAARARQKKLKPEEMSDGTFSISNLGMFGIDQFAAVINPPEGAILAVGQVREEPVIKDGAVVAGKRLSMTLSCDHRVIDGAVGASFLAELRALVEHPMRVLTG
jgi:pyruvate dehydrogenase E2 component (dihydrolipoamide acetyltransferase)